MSEIITESNNMKKGLILGFSMLGAVVALFFVSYLFRGLISEEYVSIDAVSSIELKVNGFGKIKSAEPMNESARLFMQDVDIKGDKLEDATKEIAEKLIENKEGNTAFVGAGDKSDELKEKAIASIENVAKEKSYDLQVKSLSFTENSDYKKSAHENEVSVAKYELVSKICRKDASLSREELCKNSIEELINLAKEKNISLDNFFD